jgi:NOL1/NOP2/fmu family ribosome biogenesis protein
MGITNAVVTSLRPDLLCPMFTEFFDKVIVDAPCSGEGMFRKEAAAVENWSQENVLSCAERQKKILESAASTVKPGGKIAYSTCTYSYEENEFVIKDFLQNHPDFRLVKPKINFGESAFSKYAEGVKNIEFARRIFNFNGGEGHFVAVMQREGDTISSYINHDANGVKSKDYKLFKEFFEQNFMEKAPENVCVVGDKVYITTKLPKINNLKVVRNGIFAGACKNGRFVPEHALFNNTLYTPRNVIDLQQDGMVNKFIHGEEIPCDISLKGYTQVRICGVPLGFGKASGGTLKNHYPKGLRTL